MKVEQRKPNPTYLDDIAEGDCFRFSGEKPLYMKGYMLAEKGDHHAPVTINLDTGEVRSCDHSNPVICVPVNAVVVEL